MAGHVFQTGRKYVASRAESDWTSVSPFLIPESEPNNGRHRYETDDFLSLPIYSPSVPDRRIMGVLNVTDRTDSKRYVQSDVDCLSSIADSAAIGLDNQMRREQAERSVEVLLHTVGHLAEFRDSETAGHLNRVSEYSSILAVTLRENPKYTDILTDEFIRILRMAAPLHDIGKVGIPDDILMKPGPLTPCEYEIMKTHTELGRSTLAVALLRTGPAPVLKASINIAYCHHEKYDGSGYPRGLVATEIPIEARIVALVDAYDAMTSKRCYKDSISHDDSIRRIELARGSHFDPDMVDAFLSCHEEFRAINLLPSMHDNMEPETMLRFAYMNA
jgi:response regulator RpfG family c-di-GMP phosphodiesterase